MKPGMQWARFRSDDGRVGFGVLQGGRILEYEGEMFGDAEPNGGSLEHGAYALLCPCAPSKIVALWNNFKALGEKLGKAAPTHPLFLLKAATSVIGPEEAIRSIPPPELVSRLSHDMTLLPGDVIACGTSLGVGSLKEGGAVEVSVEGIGSLRNVFAPHTP